MRNEDKMQMKSRCFVEVRSALAFA